MPFLNLCKFDMNRLPVLYTVQYCKTVRNKQTSKDQNATSLAGRPQASYPCGNFSKHPTFFVRRLVNQITCVHLFPWRFWQGHSGFRALLGTTRLVDEKFHDARNHAVGRLMPFLPREVHQHGQIKRWWASTKQTSSSTLLENLIVDAIA